ncbi:MAG: AraC family transcriptional regulator [Chloroflexi bacterium]|nr:AraC family transcriptional regulator [Chloroflexota bacterium]
MPANEILAARSRQHTWSGEGALSLKTFSQGQAYYTVGAQRYLVDESNYLILNQGQTYTITVDAPTPLTSFCLFFAPGFAEEVDYSSTTQSAILLDNPTPSRMTPLNFFEKTYPHDPLLANQLAQLRGRFSARQTERGWEQEQFHAIMQRLLAIHRATYHEIETLPALRAATREELYRRLHWARDYIASAYSQPTTLETLARIACLSPTHFLRTFKQLFHQTPHQYLTQQRLNQAKKYLLTSDQSITEICYAVGFESLGSFSWLFRRHVGCSPEQYRRAKR